MLAISFRGWGAPYNINSIIFADIWSDTDDIDTKNHWLDTEILNYDFMDYIASIIIQTFGIRFDREYFFPLDSWWHFMPPN